MAKYYFIVCMYHVFIHLSLHGYLGCLYVLPIVSCAAMNIGGTSIFLN